MSDRLIYALEQALERSERERKWIGELNKALNRANDDLTRRLLLAEAQLAVVPALVEALTRIEHWMFSVMRDDVSDVTAIKEVAGAALAAYEQAQG